MEYKICGKNIVLRLEVGEEVITSIKELCLRENIKSGYLTGIGASDDIEIGLFKVKEKKYYSTNFKDDFEITNLTGNISVMNGEPYLHIHGTFADVSGKAIGGHLNKAIISATAEIFITIIDGEINRKFDSNINLNLIDFK